MLEPVLKDGDFLADVAAARGEEDGLHLWWLGQSGFLCAWAGRTLLLDPYLSDSLTRKYAATDKPHVRMTARVVAPERLAAIDLVTASHAHTDHLDPETLRPLAGANPALALVVPEAHRQLAAERSGLDPGRLTGLDDGRTAAVAGFSVTGVASAHEGLDRDPEGRHLYLGYVVRRGPWSVYHSGDTVLYPGLAERLREFQVDLALLPVNGRKPERRVAGNLDGCEAAGLAKAMGARFVVPCHYEMFEFNTASPDEFVAEARRLAQPHAVLRAGERWTLPV
jgi:L-ascorbate metabolism protein UlaG (beta-lactamase superfamily)